MSDVQDAPQDATKIPDLKINPKHVVVEGKVLSVLSELQHALKALSEKDETYALFLGTTGLNEPEQVEVLNRLGEGDISIEMHNTDEPARWYETLYRGIWVGTFHNHRGEATLRTIEVTRFPEIPASQPEDIEDAIKQLDEVLGAEQDAE